MLEREAMALLVSARVPYMLRDGALSKAGSALAVLDEPGAYREELTQDGVTALKKAIQNRNRILDELYNNNVHLVAVGEEEYPERLMQIPRPPQLLFVQGESNLNDALPIAIVGTRSASEYGLRHTEAISGMLAQYGACIVSGLAVGIDAAAHRGALAAKGRTVAVLGGALDRFFPMENSLLRDRMLENSGSIVSEYPMGMPPTRYSFLHRNRIIAGMTMGTLVTDGPVRSGALRTATDAADYGREVFALPGDVDAPGSALPHKLIAEGAHLAANAGDILRVLAPQFAMEINGPGEKTSVPKREKQDKAKAIQEDIRQESRPKEKNSLSVPPDLPQEERAVLTVLLAGEMEFDQLCEATGMDGAALGAVLMGLEMEGLIDTLPGLRYAISG